jgi:hypothetical protein
MARHQFGAAFSIAVLTAIGVALFLGGYFLCVDPNYEAYGWALFLLVPCVVGFAIGAVGRQGLYVIGAIVFTTVLSLLSLIFVGFEGWICCAMAFPLLIVPMAVGALVGYFVRGRFLDRENQKKRNTLFLLLISPFLMAAANQVEKPWRGVQRFETFSSEVIVPRTLDDTWNSLVRMPAMEGEKPFLLQIGLPVPYRCTLDRDAVGGCRTCYFDQGVIEMEVTEWHRPDTVGFTITRNTLPGRRWLTFVGASYELVPEADGTRVIRYSTIASRLYPRWYWRQFERWGVVSEHQFVLSSLATSAAAAAAHN